MPKLKIIETPAAASSDAESAAESAAERLRLLRQLHGQRRRTPGLMDDQAWRDWLEQKTGSRSIKALDLAALRGVLVLLGGAPRRWRPPAQAHIRLLYVLWKACAEQGAVRSAQRRSLNAWVRRMTKKEVPPGGIADVEWLTAAQAHPLIEALKQMRDRH